MGKVGTATFEDRSPDNGYFCFYPFSVSGVPVGEKSTPLSSTGQGDKGVSEGTSRTARLSFVTLELEYRPSLSTHVRKPAI